MENKEQNVVENTTKVEKESIKNNTLIRKTKAQLIEIILRKDDVERKLRNTINKQRGLIWFLVIIFVISIISNIALYLI